jgi:hypothetical protein
MLKTKRIASTAVAPRRANGASTNPYSKQQRCLMVMLRWFLELMLGRLSRCMKVKSSEEDEGLWFGLDPKIQCSLLDQKEFLKIARYEIQEYDPIQQRERKSIISNL